MLHKTFDLLDAKADAEAGTFEATVAVFGNVDKGGDRIQPGAFKNTLDAWKASGDPIPVILSHQWDNPMAHIGVVQDAKETDKGLWVKGTLDVADNEVAKQVHRLMARRSLKEFSFGYEVPKGGQKRAKDGANDLTEINLAELGPTLKGMNPATELHAVKTALAEKQLASVTRDLLESAGRDRYATDPNSYVYVDDFDPDSDWVVYCVGSPTTEERYLKTTYNVNADNTVTLGDTEVEVTRTTSYQPKSAETLRAAAQRVAREVEQDLIPKVPEQPKALEPENDLEKQLQEVKAMVAEMAEGLEDLKKRADVTGKESEGARSVDPLRQQAEALALDVASGGMSLRRQPKTIAPKTPEPALSLRELREQTRDTMLTVLSGGIDE